MQPIVRKTQLRTKLSQYGSVATARTSSGQCRRRTRGSRRHLPYQRASNLGFESCLVTTQATILFFHPWNAPRLQLCRHCRCPLGASRCLTPRLAEAKGIHSAQIPFNTIVLIIQVDFINSHIGVAFSIPIVMLDASDALNANQIARVIGTFGKSSRLDSYF